jgi:hypothetical protein
VDPETAGTDKVGFGAIDEDGDQGFDGDRGRGESGWT